ncbi:MAG: 3-phosphoserine/phosphohydroxythreonine transaminase [Planctomycetota bacterium]|nr:3-phosphoserine/phosphohydroxythreonine transaminase [Planctomycetota bacterium]
MSQDTSLSRQFNFCAGPAALPLRVLEQAQKDLLALPGTGASVLEISHRSPVFKAILHDAESRLRRLLAVPDGYTVLFLQGGSRLQFSMVPMNLLRDQAADAQYVLTGSWGLKACEQARLEGPVQVVWDGAATGYDRLPDDLSWDDSGRIAYRHFTSNETIQGVQFRSDPEVKDMVLVCDASSDFLSRPIDVQRYGLIYACAQKNAGPAGVTIVIIRDQLLERSADSLPGYLSYREHAQEGSLYNTPCTFGIYMVGLVAQWLEDEVGGLLEMNRRNQAKASELYDALDSSEGFYQGHAQPDCRSLMNVTFRLPSSELDDLFVERAEAEGLCALRGHRSVGGIRASIYNAVPEAGVTALVEFMREFRGKLA